MGERKVKVEIRIGRDEDGDWWTVLMVDGNEAHGADHTNIGQPPRKRDSISPQRLAILMMKPSDASPKEACQLDTETRFVLVPANRRFRWASAARTITKSGTVDYSLC